MIQACHTRLSETIPRSPYYKIEPQHVFGKINLAYLLKYTDLLILPDEIRAKELSLRLNLDLQLSEVFTIKNIEEH